MTRPRTRPSDDDLVAFIVSYRDDIGIPPSVREMAAEFDMSINGMHGALNDLVESGRIRRVPGVARGIVIQ